MAGILGKKPKPQPVVTMPDQNDPAALAAGAAKVNQMRDMGGRDSTLLSVDQMSEDQRRKQQMGQSALGSYTSRNLGSS